MYVCRGKKAKMPTKKTPDDDTGTFTVPGVKIPKNVRPLANLKTMAVDYAALGHLLEGLARGYLKQWVDGNR